jgi:predicted nuclease with TOPRIM domain
MTMINLQEKDIPVIQSSLDFKKKALEFNIKRYRQRLDELEKRFGMTSKEFIKQFQSGILGDEPHWFEWEYIYEVYEESMKQFNEVKP